MALPLGFYSNATDSSRVSREPRPKYRLMLLISHRREQGVDIIEILTYLLLNLDRNGLVFQSHNTVFTSYILMGKLIMYTTQIGLLDDNCGSITWGPIVQA